MSKFFESLDNISNWAINSRLNPISKTMRDVNPLVFGDILKEL